MAHKNYEQGRRYEYKERDLWEERGFFVERSYGSFGSYDLVATNGVLTLFIEVKSYRGRLRKKYKDSIEKLSKIPDGPNIKKLLVVYGPIKRGRATPRWVMEIREGDTKYIKKEAIKKIDATVSKGR